MIPFADTSFICALYRDQEESALADRIMGRLRHPVTVSALVLWEFRQAVRFNVYLHTHNRTTGYSSREATLLLEALKKNMLAGALHLPPVSWPEVHQRAEILSARHTAAKGCRPLDILHVATALELGSGEFLTFDVNQRKLAEAEGLTIPGLI